MLVFLTACGSAKVTIMKKLKKLKIEEKIKLRMIQKIHLRRI